MTGLMSVLRILARHPVGYPLICFIAGLVTVFAQPPFAASLHPAFALFPLLSFFMYMPLLMAALLSNRRRALFGAYLFGVGANVAQFFWIAEVSVDGLWPLIMLGLVLLTAFLGLQWLLLAAIWRLMYRRLGIISALAFPAVWVVFDWLRTLGDMSFPWGFAGYNLVGIPVLSQFASLTGVWGCTWIIIAGNVLALCLFRGWGSGQGSRRLLPAGLFVGLLVLIAGYGLHHMSSTATPGPSMRVALVQNNMDQANWDPKASLDSSLKSTRAMILPLAAARPDLIVLPESGIYCYYATNRHALSELRSWEDSLHAAFAFGSLHYERLSNNPFYKYFVYNSVFLEVPDAARQRYDKMRLVPFSEALPFEGMFPILSRLNIGESDFSRGKVEAVLHAPALGIGLAPALCYEIIYPDFVRRRAAAGADVLLNLTNDGWFGRTNAPWQHAAMARMRAIENGLPLLRCANSGISFATDACGRVLGRTGLYERTVLLLDVPRASHPTLYRLMGDWFVGLCALGLLFSLPFLLRQPRN